MPENLTTWSEDGRLPANEHTYFPWTNVFSRDLKSFANEVHRHNMAAGWWTGFEEDKKGRTATCLMLVLTELSEAVEADRKSLGPCKHLPHYDSFDTELADALIRLLDYGCATGWTSRFTFHDPESKRAIDHMTHLMDDKPRVDQLWFVARKVSDKDIHGAICALLALAEFNGIPVIDIAVEKHAYNKVRADHKKEAREAEGGKKY